MRHLHELGLFIPEWMIPWCVVAAIGAAILGWSRIATSLSLFVAVDVLVWPLLEPWLDQLPVWALVLGAILLPLLVVHSLIALVFGEAAAGQFTGTWLVRIADALLLGPLRMLRSLWQLLL